MNNNNNNNVGWNGVFSSVLGIFLIAGPIGFICSIFSNVLALIFMVVIPFIAFIYFVYDEFGTKEKREQNKKYSEERKKEYYNKTHNSDGSKKTRKQIAQEAADKKMKTINSYGVYPTKIISNNFGYSTVYIDDNNEKIYVEALYNNYVFDYKDILDFELVVDNTTQIKYSLSTAITGTFKSKGVVSNILVKIYLNNIDNPIIEVRSLGNGSYHNVNSMEAYAGRKFADELIGVLTYIKNKNK